MAFNWVVLPMATVACAGTTATDFFSAAAAPPSSAASVGAIVSVPVTAELTLAAGGLATAGAL